MAYKPSPQTLARAALAKSKMSSAKKAAPKAKPADVELEKGKSAAAAKRIKVAPRKVSEIDPNSVRAMNAARQQAYMAKGGRQPIGAMGSGGSNVMAGSGHSTIKDIKASIKAGVNPRVSLDRYEGERAKKIGPRTLKKESVDEALSPERKRMFDLKLKLIKKVANRPSTTRPSKFDMPRNALNPAKDMKLEPRAHSDGVKDYYKKMMESHSSDDWSAPFRKAVEVTRKAYSIKLGKNPETKTPEWVKKGQQKFDAQAAAQKPAGRQAGTSYGKYLAAAKQKKLEEGRMKDIATDREETERLKAQELLGGPVKSKSSLPPGKHPAGYRRARNLARSALKNLLAQRKGK